MGCFDININNWDIRCPDRKLLAEMKSKTGLSHLSVQSLYANGIVNSEQAMAFLGENDGIDEKGLFDPLGIPDMEKAAAIINEAVDNGERICIYGDYDCDGIMSTAALYNFLYSMDADVCYFINERADGYGINKKNIQKIIDEMGAELIVTVDNGISAFEEAELCKELGVRLVVTDHHTPSDRLPDAEAVVDPHINSADNTAEFHDICGCGVVFKLIQTMSDGDSIFALENYADLTAIATIGDVMPLQSENRTLVKHGMHYIENTDNLGLRALIDELSVSADGKRRDFKITARNIAFQICPRINACGRIDSAMLAAELFTTEDEERASELAKKLCELNVARKSIEDNIKSDISRVTENDPSIFSDNVIVISGEGWHKGVIGINAAKICESTGKPTFLISVGEDGKATGSARAPISDFSVYTALSLCSDILPKFGGHKGAGGFSLMKDDIPELRRRLNEYAKDMYFEPKITVSGAVDPLHFTVEEIETLYSELEPFGEKNEEPVFYFPNTLIKNIISLSGGKHTKISAEYSGKPFEFMLFSTGKEEFPFAEGDSVELIASLGVNTFRDKKTISLTMKDIRRTGLVQSRLLAAEKAYRSFRAGVMPEKRIAERMLPTRESYIAVYTLIRDSGVTEDYIFHRLCDDDKNNLCRLHIILDVLEESGLIRRDLSAGRIAKLPFEKGFKADFEKTATITRLRTSL